MSMTFFIPQDTTALALGSDSVALTMASELKERGVEGGIIRNGSRGMFWLEPLLEVEIDGSRLGFGPVKSSDMPSILDSLNSRTKNTKSLNHPLFLGEVNEIDYLARQQRLTFNRAGVGDPLCIENYQRLSGFVGLTHAIKLKGQEIVDQIKDSGLRGRGGAAFPAGIKWQTVLDTVGEQKYIVCNADEGDSGTFADRLLMEADPYQLIEGMAIAGLAVGANQGYIYLRSEYPVAHKILNQAIESATEAGFLGENICSSGSDFFLEVRLGAGASICGEETSLLESLEGKSGMVRAKPQFQAVKG